MEITDDYYILYIENDMLQMQQKTDFVIMHSAGCFLQEKADIMLAKATDEQKDSLKKIWKWICNS